MERGKLSVYISARPRYMKDKHCFASRRFFFCSARTNWIDWCRFSQTDKFNLIQWEITQRFHRRKSEPPRWSTRQIWAKAEKKICTLQQKVSLKIWWWNINSPLALLAVCSDLGVAFYRFALIHFQFMSCSIRGNWIHLLGLVAFADVIAHYAWAGANRREKGEPVSNTSKQLKMGFNLR